ncbi:hypothetical protein ZWY2020_007849 [Hordeum vulgare]|nr:hypothetical protein ZWY2020_007849 [Hordeum vulgare]
MVRPFTAGPRLSPEKSDPTTKEVEELHDGPLEESKVRRSPVIGFRSKQPYLRTVTLPRRRWGNPERPALRAHSPKHLLHGDDTITIQDHQPHHPPESTGQI